MTHKFVTPDIANVLRDRSLPGITLWNRLEGRPRADNFERALRAEIRDALWMVARQWQMGEYRGDDAGSPILAKVRLETTRLRKYKPAQGDVEAFTDAVPLEAQVEQMPIAFTMAGREMALDIRLLAGRHWLKLVEPLAPATRSEFIAAYPIRLPDPTQAADASTCAHLEAWSSVAAVAGRRMDGVALYQHLKADAGHHASDGIPALAGLVAETDAIASRFIAWLEKLFYQPTQPSAWLGDRLEYQFTCAAPTRQGEKVLVAEQYYHGHLDWYNFDVDPSRDVLGAPLDNPAPLVPATLTMLPTQVTFNGMPHSRWWTFEDGRTNFGDVKPDTTDLAKLLLIEFGLVYANDWYIIPFTVPAGTIATVRGMAVTNVFGERVWIEAAGRGGDDDWQRWAMFLVSVAGKGDEPADLSLVVPPAAQQVTQAPPIEEVWLARDEMANQVWAIEKTIPLSSGEPKDGRAAAFEMRRFFERDLERRLGAPPEAPPPAGDAKIRYQVMTSVPENWIPMIPVHVEDDTRRVQLQRAAMPRVLVGDPGPPVPVRPRTSLLRQGLDQPTPVPYFLHEEEVPRAGVRVTKAFQRTRWRDGRVWVWLGVRKQTGRGEGSSGLTFDRIVDVPRRSQ